MNRFTAKAALKPQDVAEAQQGGGIGRMIVTAIQRFAQRIAFVDAHGEQTRYHELGRMIELAMAAFKALGLRRGDGVMQLSGNWTEVFAIVAAAYLSGIRSSILHTLTPSAIASRLTSLGAPDSLQGAVAAGILGAGARYLGTSEKSALFWRECLASVDDLLAVSDTQLADVADATVKRCRAQRIIIPGLGHPIHVNGDPRTIRAIEQARHWGVFRRALPFRADSVGCAFQCHGQAHAAECGGVQGRGDSGFRPSA